MSKRLDFKALNDRALQCAEATVAHFAPDGKLENREWVARNPNRNDSRLGSFSINVDTGVWSDFATGDKGGDLVSYVACIKDTSQGKAYKILADYLGLNNSIDSGDQPSSKSIQRNGNKNNNSFIPIYPPPAEAIKNCPVHFRQFGKASEYWDYKDNDGNLLMRVCRFDRINSENQRTKEYRPVVYGKKQNEDPRWHWRQLPDSRPLYGLESIKKFSASTPVVLVEGEKACDAARSLFPDRPCTTWSGGSKAIRKTDFAALVGREVWLWPDNDKAGSQTIEDLRSLLIPLGVSALRTVDLSVFSKYSIADDGSLIPASTVWPEKADAFDAKELGWTADHINILKTKEILLLPLSSQDSKTAQESSTCDIMPSDNVFGFRVDDAGVWNYDAKAEKQRRICARLDVLARSRDGNGSGQNWGILVSFKDYDGVKKELNIPQRLFAADGGREIKQMLLDNGLAFDGHRESQRKVLEYLQAASPTNRVGLVYKMGWHHDVFVLPEKTIGKANEDLLFYSEGAPICKLSKSGTLDEWKEHISFYCKDNPLALFAVSAAFSAPLVELLGQETMGFHFYGDSSWGKSTLLNLACSVYGNPDDYKKTWRATDNALEGVAAAHSDLLLALDEINQVDPRAIGEVVYMLGNGHGKQRANDRGQARDSKHRWRLTFLSNGEKTLEQYLAESGKSQTGGMEMRFIGLRASLHEDENESRRMGVFNDAHEFSGGAGLSEHLNDSAKRYHGTAFIEFLNSLTTKLEDKTKANFVSWALRQTEEFRAEVLTCNAGGQVIRAARKFALVALAGELATHWGITGWYKGEAREAAKACFIAWLKARGGEGNLEDKQMLDHVRHQLIKYGESKFKRWDQQKEGEDVDTVIDSHVPITAESWGYRREIIEKDSLEGDSSDIVFYVFKEAFQRDLCRGFDSGRVARLLRDIGALQLTESDKSHGRLLSRTRLPRTGKNPIYTYRILNSILLNQQ